ncbi:MAG: hypothetical protein AAF747_10390 [Planctomycetota bacterium]
MGIDALMHLVAATQSGSASPDARGRMLALAMLVSILAIIVLVTTIAVLGILRRQRKAAAARERGRAADSPPPLDPWQEAGRRIEPEPSTPSEDETP